MLDKDKKFYSVDDVAKLLGIHKATAYEIVKELEDQGKVIRLKRMVRIEAEVLEEWIENHKRG